MLPWEMIFTPTLRTSSPIDQKICYYSLCAHIYSHGFILFHSQSLKSVTSKKRF